MESGITPQVELRLKLIEKDIELLQARHKEFEDFMKQTQQLNMKMTVLEEKIDVLSSQMEKAPKQGIHIDKTVLTIITLLVVIVAGILGISIPGM